MENKVKNYASGLFMILFLAFAAASAGADVLVTRGDVSAGSVKEVAQGKWTPLYEKAFNKKLSIYEWCKTGWGALNYSIFHEGNDGVLVGRNNWLFTREEFDPGPGSKAELHAKVNFVSAVNQYLKGYHTALLVVPVPAKARVYNQYLGRYRFPSYKNDIYANFLKEMRFQSIPAVDVLQAMQSYKDPENLFLRTDTHWTPQGARLAAQAIAAYVAQNLPQISYDKIQFETLPETQTDYEGDLMRYIPCGNLSGILGLRPEKLQKMKTRKIESEVSPEDLGNQLFSDSTPEITLVGTSYSANPNWNFEGFLKQYMQADILNAAQEGLGPFETMKKYLDNKAFKSSPPRLIIWEIPERYLTFDYDLKTEFYNPKGV